MFTTREARSHGDDAKHRSRSVMTFGPFMNYSARTRDENKPMPLYCLTWILMNFRGYHRRFVIKAFFSVSFKLDMLDLPSSVVSFTLQPNRSFFAFIHQRIAPVTIPVINHLPGSIYPSDHVITSHGRLNDLLREILHSLRSRWHKWLRLTVHPGTLSPSSTRGNKTERRLFRIRPRWTVMPPVIPLFLCPLSSLDRRWWRGWKFTTVREQKSCDFSTTH